MLDLLANRAGDESLSSARTIGGVRARTPDPSRTSLRRSDFKTPSGTEALRLTERFRRRPTIGRTICCRRAELAASYHLADRQADHCSGRLLCSAGCAFKRIGCLRANTADRLLRILQLRVECGPGISHPPPQRINEARSKTWIPGAGPV